MVVPHSVLVSTSRRVNMLQLLRLMMALTPAPDLYLAAVLMSCTLVWLRESPASTSQC